MKDFIVHKNTWSWGTDIKIIADGGKGFVELQLITDKDYTHRACTYGYIGGLSVLPECRNKGLGSSVLQTAEIMTLEAGRNNVYLKVDLDKPENKDFYEKRGYSVYDKDSDYWYLEKQLK